MIILICGLSRAGKTTYSKKFKDLKVIHFDECGGYGMRYQCVNHKVSKCIDDIVVEGIYPTKTKRIELLEAYKGEGSTCIWLDTPKEIRKKRVDHMLLDDPFEPPTYEEGWDKIIIIKGDSEWQKQ